ncbi:hypothetical protein JCM10207_005731 [Rhodosporidiobolus poonsookiae]
MADGQELKRIDILQQAFGNKDLAKAFEDNLDDQAKAHFEAYKFKLEQQKPVYKQRAELAKKVPQFWAKSLQNCKNIEQFIDAVDADAFEHLTDVWIEHDTKDVREFEVKFTFSAKNPYFKETTLAKRLTLTPPASLSPKPDTPSSFDLEAPLYLAASTPISWTSKDHDLTKKAPRGTAPTDLEEFDVFEGPGSFFNWFADEGEDVTSLGESLLEWWGHAAEYAAGLASLDDMSEDGSDLGGEFDFDDEDESEDDDLKKEIDLSDEEKRPKKKQRSKK